jgi:large subunit ribosomal protein L6
MSRVGKQPIRLKSGVKVNMAGQVLKAEGPKGKLSVNIPVGIEVKVAGTELSVTRKSDEFRSLHGATRAAVANVVEGVSEGFTRELDVVGVGFRAAVKGQVLSLTIGFSHTIDYTLPAGIAGKVDNNTHIVLTGSDKVLLGMVASKVRGFRPPEPYQGKGIRYTNEKIIKKEGKAAGAGAAGGK